MKGSLNTGG